MTTVTTRTGCVNTVPSSWGVITVGSRVRDRVTGVKGNVIQTWRRKLADGGHAQLALVELTTCGANVVARWEINVNDLEEVK